MEFTDLEREFLESIKENNPDDLSVLLASHPELLNLESPMMGGRIALATALQHESYRAAEKLLECGADINEEFSSLLSGQENLLHICLTNEHFDGARFLLNRGAVRKGEMLKLSKYAGYGEDSLTEKSYDEFIENIIKGINPEYSEDYKKYLEERKGKMHVFGKGWVDEP